MDAPFGYYTAPAVVQGRPVVIVLFRVYAALGALVCLTGMAVGIVASTMPYQAGVPLALVVAMVSMFLVVALVHIVAAAAPFKPWGWTLGVVTLALGCMSGAIFLAVPLLVHWLRPRCRAAFMRA